MRSRCPLALLAAGACLVAILAAHRPAHATVVRYVSRGELVALSDLVVRVTVLSQHSAWNEDQSQIRTFTRLRVNRYLKGSGAAELTLRQLGGTVGDVSSRVPGDASLHPGDDLVLFLRRGPGDVVFLTALTLAAYHVVHTPGREPAVHRDLDDVTIARFPTQGPMVLVPPSAEPAEALEHLIADVLALVRGTP